MKKYTQPIFYLAVLLVALPAYGQDLNQLKTAIFPDNGPTPFETTGTVFHTTNYTPSGSFWASPFDESQVFHALLEYEHPTNPDRSYELRVGKGGQIYSFVGSFGESVPPQHPAHAPWVDEVWQMVTVDGSLNMPDENKKYFIHQAGVYLRTPAQTQPFYSPVVAEYYDAADQSYTIVNWGQQAHTADNLISGYTSSILYYTRFKNLGDGVIQVDMMIFNFGNDTMSFINIPWGGVRQSALDHWFVSAPDHSYQEYTGNFGAYTGPLTGTGGWVAFSSNSQGTNPSLGLLMDNDEGTLRMGDAGSIANRNYTVFEGIKFPGTDIGPGKSVRARNFYFLDSAIDDIQSTILSKGLENETFYGPYNKTVSEVDETTYGFSFQSGELTAAVVPSGEGLTLALQPYQNSDPVFIIKSSEEEYRVTTDLYTYSPYPYDGNLAEVELLGFRDNPTVVEIESVTICEGGTYTFPDGTVQSNIVNEVSYLSDVGQASNGFDSLVWTQVFTTPYDIPTNNFVQNGPGGVGSTNGASFLALWLSADQLLGSAASQPANGTSVSQWNDLSGNSYNYTSTGANQPTYNSSAFPAVSFASSGASGQFLSSANDKFYAYGSAFFAFQPVDNGAVFPMLNNTSASLNYQQASNVPFLGYSQQGGSLYTSTLPALFNQDRVVSFHADCMTSLLSIDAGSNNNTVMVNASPVGIPTGKLGSANDKIAGKMYEVITYQAPLNSVQKLLVDNYLSAKYGGLPIANDVYNEDDPSNGNFDYNLAGIGRANATNIHEDAKGTGILRVNEPTDLDDNEYFLWADNGEDLAFTTTTGLPAGFQALTEIVWRVSSVNSGNSAVSVGAVNLAFDLSAAEGIQNNIALLIDTDGDGSFADETPIASSSVETNAFEGQLEIVFQGVTIQDGNRFCLGLQELAGPGGVAQGLALWLRADDGLTVNGSGNLFNWEDKSANELYVLAQGPVPNNTTDHLINFNPVVTFDGVNDQLSIGGGVLGNNTYNSVNLFFVHRINAEPHQSTIIRESVVGGSISSHLPWSNGQVFWDAGIGNGDARINAPSGLSAGDDACWSLLSFEGDTDYQAIRRNGAVLAQDNTAQAITGNGSNTYLGSAGGGLYSNGDLAEVIIYKGNDALTGDNLQKIETYLALKYGYTLATDYLNAENTVVWDASDNTYHNDVIGIAKDECNDLLQKQSKTKDGQLRLYLDALAVLNNNNPDDISNDLSSIIIGNDQGDLRDNNPGSTLERPNGIHFRLEREWKVINTNFQDDYTLAIEWEETDVYDINDIRLLVDTDGDFTNAQIIGSPNVSISEGSFIVSGINPAVIPMNSTRYITLASVNPPTNVLPVELEDFQATLIDKKVELSWRINSSSNNDYFTIARSADGVNWVDIIQLNAQDNARRLYTTIDQEPLAGESYYRLQQTDFDGTTTYLGVRTIYLSARNDRITIYPNPTSEKLTISSANQVLEDFSIYNVLGQEVRSKVNVLASSPKVYQLNVSLLESGLYLLRINGQTQWFMRE